MTKPVAHSDKRKLLAGLILLAIITFIIYIKTLCPTVFVGDPGELIAASWTLGIPHSPGYPLYTLLGYLFVYAPFGENPAVRMNFMTAIFSILSVLVLFRLTVLITGEHVISFFSSLIYATGLITWSQSVVSEVYTLNNFVVCLTLLLIVLTAIHKKTSWLYAAAFLSGLSLTTHQTSLLILPAAIWLLISVKALPLSGKLSRWGWSLLFFFLGLSLYAYLPIAASMNPAMNWGDPSTLENFIKVVFAPISHQVHHGFFIDHLVHLIQIYFHELAWIGAILSITGLILSIAPNTVRHLKFIAIVQITYTVFFLATMRPIYLALNRLDVYYMPVFMTGALFIAVGIRFLFDYIIKHREGLSRQVVLSMFSVLVAFCVVWNISSNWNENDQSDNYFAEWYGRNLLESCDENALLLCNFDDLFILFYMQHVLEVRPDVTAIPAHFPKRGETAFWAMWLYDQLLEDESINWSNTRDLFFKSSATETIIETFIDENIDNRPVFFTFYRIPPLELMKMDYRFEPYKYCYRVKEYLQDYDVIENNYDYFSQNYEVDFFHELFKKHNNVEEAFILVRLDEIFKFNYSLLFGVEDYERAHFFITLASAVNPLDDTNWWLKSNLEEKLGKFGDAAESLEEIIQLYFLAAQRITYRILDLRYQQARLLHQAGDNRTAADILNQFYPMDDRQPDEILQLAKEIEEALSVSD